MAFSLGIARNPQWLEDVRSKLRQAPHEPISRYRHNRTGEACPERSRRNNADAHLKRNATRQVARDGPRGRRGAHRRAARFWPLGADLLRRV
jgi:hypothetical protein